MEITSRHNDETNSEPTSGHEQKLDLFSQSLPKEGDRVHEYPTKKRLIPVLLAICLATFLASLDRTIIGVAVPAISNDFGTFDDISWYESGYLLTFSVFQLPSGKIYTYFCAKWVFITFVSIFVASSILCAAAPTSPAFIVGRAISGIGSAGMSTGGQVLLADLLPLEKRPKYQGFLAATFGLAAIAGPLLGGVFSSEVSWRWCFWINLPIGGVALVVLFLLLPAKPAARKQTAESWGKRLLQFDPIGVVLVTPGLILLLLALQWGGEKGDWASPRVLGTLIPGIALLIGFVGSQIWAGENGTVPPRIIRQRSIAAASVTALGFGSALIIVTFYLPIWYQAIQGLSAVDAGVRLLGYFLSTVVFVIVSGGLVSKLGYYAPFMIAGTAIMVVGSGLLTTLRTNSGDAQVVGYQVLFGIGMGLTLAQPMIAAQTVLSREDLPTGLTLINFLSFVGGTIFVSVSQSILSHTLGEELRQSLPDLDVPTTLANGATGLSDAVTPEQLPLLLAAYNKGITNVFYCALVVSALALVAACFSEWRTVKQPQKADEELAEEKSTA